jgi:hypothetical protein
MWRFALGDASGFAWGEEQQPSHQRRESIIAVPKNAESKSRTARLPSDGNHCTPVFPHADPRLLAPTGSSPVAVPKGDGY